MTAGLDAISNKGNLQLSGDYLIIKVLIDSDWTISKGLCSTGSSDVVWTANASSMVNSSGSFANRSSTASEVLYP